MSNVKPGTLPSRDLLFSLLVVFVTDNKNAANWTLQNAGLTVSVISTMYVTNHIRIGITFLHKKNILYSKRHTRHP